MLGWTTMTLTSAKSASPGLALRLVALVLKEGEGKRALWLRNFTAVAEFLVHEIRSADNQSGSGNASNQKRTEGAAA
jgi:hypothetical protein